MRRVIATTFVPLIVSLAWWTPPPAAGVVGPARPSDFNGDGHADLVVGVPMETLGREERAGVVHVLYGSATGITASGDELWSQDTPGIKGIAHRDDRFGSELAMGDFDADGFGDLAIHSSDPVAGVGGGSVHVLYGSPGGLTADGDQQWLAPLPIGGGACFGYGDGLAVADFDVDGYPDLAIGASGCAVEGVQGAGAVHVLHGSPAGLTANGSVWLTQASGSVPTDPQLGESFGSELAAGDLDGNGYPDLAIGVPGETEPLPTIGVVDVVYGSAAGLDGSHSQAWSQETPGVPDETEGWELFGRDLEIADFDADGHDDLVISNALESINGADSSGAVTVLYGSAAGLTGARIELWSQATAGVPSAAESTDRFGTAVAVGDFDGDGDADIAIGTPSEDVGSIVSAGTVTVLRGSPTGLTSSGAQLWTQNSRGIPNAAESRDRFGFSVAAADYGRSARDDLAIGSYTENLGGIRNAGMVHVLYGTTNGLSSTGVQAWSQGSPGIKGTMEPQDRFGEVLAP